jgi:pimeloyl-ACP methyl ester carboxylesterase
MHFHHLTIATGPRLHYAESGAAGGEAIVFLHGWPDSWFSFSRVAELMPPRYRLFLLDQRGFGDSERPERGYEIRDMAADVVAFLDAAAISRATIVGHSFGSFVARSVAITVSDRVERLVLIGSGWTALNGVTSEVHASLHGLPDPVPAAFAREFQAGTAFAPVPSAFFERIIAESLKLPARLWVELLGAVINYDDVSELNRIAARTLLLWAIGMHSFPGLISNAFLLPSRARGCEFYPEIGHCPNWECPGDVAADIVAFMSEV